MRDQPDEGSVFFKNSFPDTVSPNFHVNEALNKKCPLKTTFAQLLGWSYNQGFCFLLYLKNIYIYKKSCAIFRNEEV